MFSAFCIIVRKSPDCSVAIFWLFTLREAGAVVLVQSVSRSTETYVRTIWKLSAKMLATPVSVAATVGGQAYCEGADTDTELAQQSDFFILSPLMTVPEMSTHPCHSCVHGNHLHICRHRFQIGECKSLRSCTETTGTDPQLQTGSIPEFINAGDHQI